ncbi:Similar to Slc24a4: Sodium/potassium/calcium exchanger 4 (Mus musculus) [Cotesia congregata]|uniref:Similar to Slc24a4: Sodium/potassium/calcium exchanger 4 (Mus musculus) n=1 Tax=Cotesia congregata TaxID=51543 RepID=A0A8J2MK01_COTCN|nr:Similar to Slc24a4: Sodium/potassium/calcium exchanger 4 (Mus musculus) [Cotesia congregata]
MDIRFNRFLSLVIILSLGFEAINSEDQGLSYDSDNLTLTEIKNCSNERSVEDFPEDIFTRDQLQHGAALLHTFFGFYCFLLTAYVCNDYLLPALDIICAELKISADVAGATFLATASCFPELFVNVVGTFLTESDLGVGTVVGGAVFNTFATPAFGALSAAQVNYIIYIFFFLIFINTIL